MSFRKEITTAFKLIKYNLWALVSFELVYKLIVTVFTVRLMRALVALSMQISGIAILTQENFTAWILHPFSVLCAVVLILLSVFITLFDMMAVIRCLDASWHHQKMTMREMMAAGAQGAARALQPRNWMIWVFVLLIVPYTGSTVTSGFITSIEIPGFVEDYMIASFGLSMVLLFVSIGSSMLAFWWALSIHTFLHNAENYSQACRQSRKLLKKRKWHTLVSLFLWSICLQLLSASLQGALVAQARAVIKLWAGSSRQSYLISIAAAEISHGLRYIMGLLAVPLTFSFLTALYYAYAQASGWELTPYQPPTLPPRKHRLMWGISGVVVAVFLLMTMVGGTIDTIADMMPSDQPEIAAHRGSSIEKPENTMPAYEQAIADGADWIELDVHQTSDGVIVISHDADMKRTAGVNRYIYDMSYEELSSYDVGSWFSPEYSNLRIITLDEVLKAMKGRIKVNIELKPTGHEANFEENVIQVVRDNAFEDDCVLASLNTDCLKRVKELAPDLQTLYLFVYAQGNIKKADFADGFSIEESGLTRELVFDIHEQGKKVWAWTLNTEKSITKMQEIGVDYLLTDDPIMARATIIAKTPLFESMDEFLKVFSEDEDETEDDISEYDDMEDFEDLLDEA